jgi:hypothetical protein
VRAIFWWLNESGEPPLPPPIPPPPPPTPPRQQLRQQADRIMRMDYRQFMKFKREKSPPPFNWHDDGCSGPFGLREAYRRLFDQPCQQHDFGYRNYGQPKGLKLGRNNEVRKWIDKRLLQEMRRLCKIKFRDLIHPRIGCLEIAHVVWGAVRLRGRDAFYKG